MIELPETRCDVLVVGCGLAGLRAARDCAAAGLQVLQIAAGGFCSGSSFYPLTEGLGAQLPDGDDDKERFLQEVLDAGAGMASPRLCAILIDEAAGQVARLGELGIETVPVAGRAACFARRERRLRSWSDWPAIRTAAGERLRQWPNYAFRDRTALLRIVTAGGATAGALTAGPDGTLTLVRTPAVILASGGLCGLYRHSLNTPDVCGIGHSVALDAGAALVNLEFLQFIPGLTVPVYRLLFHEFTLRHCVSVADADGRPVLEPLLPPGLTARACLDQRAMHGPFTTRDDSRYFEYAMLRAEQNCPGRGGAYLRYSPNLSRDPNPYTQMACRFYRDHGIDLTARPIAVLPFAHCANGGVAIDEHGRTGVPGLYAAGEAAGGVHGADRHGGMATTAALVFGARAAAAVIADRPEAAGPAPRDVVDALRAQVCGDGSGPPSGQLRRQLGQRLWEDAGVVRSGPALESLLRWLIDARLGLPVDGGSDLPAAVADFHRLRAAEALVRAMLLRTERRGPHDRADFPAPDPQLSRLQTQITDQNGLHAGWRAVPG